MEKYLDHIGAKHRIRDPLYGYIWLTDEELKIIDTPIFQRLRRIQQLALTKYVYPAAEHSRFVHSLGVLHSATKMFYGIMENDDTKLPYGDKLRYLKALRFAALLHDIGHLPFSHGVEDVLLEGVNHEDVGQFIIKNYRPISDIVDDELDKVINILSSEVRKKYRLIHEIISGQLDADRADYLMRDSYFCGVKYGEYDYNRYMQSFGAFEDDSALTLFIKERDIYVVESFLLARYHYNLQVPFHRTRVGYDITLRKYFEHLKENGKFKQFIEYNEEGKINNIDLGYFESLDDYMIVEMIKSESRENNWAKMLLRQNHLKPIFDVVSNKPSKIPADEFFKRSISVLENNDYVKDEDFFTSNTKVELSKLIETTENIQNVHETDVDEVTSEDGFMPKNTIYVKDSSNQCHDIAECSEVIKSMKTKLRLLRIYALPELCADLIELIKSTNTQ